MMKTSIVSAKGWVVIPRELRERFRLRKGDRVVFVEYGGLITLIPASKNPVSESAGMLKGDRSLVEALLESRHEDAGQGK